MGVAGANRARENQTGPAFGRTTRTLLQGECDMFDYTPLTRSAIGFDRLFRLLDEAQGVEAPSYPPYNIERLGENAYRITMAVAGFAPSDISIEAKGHTLTVTGKKEAKTNDNAVFVHQGIAARGFERRFQLADYVEVKGADLDNGLLHISLVREVPEAMKPRQIAINATSKAKQIEAVAA
jgi:molecular chaperone IbpA